MDEHEYAGIVLTYGAVNGLIDAETGNGMEKAGQMAHMEMSLMIKTIVFALCGMKWVKTLPSLRV